jgi:hypothetical protein
MKTAWISLILTGVLVGCGGGGGTTDSAGTTTNPSGTTTNPSGTTDGSATGTTTDAPTSGTADTTSPPDTSTTVDPVTSTLPTTETDPSGTTIGETGTTAATDPDTTGGPPSGGVCMDDKDCTLQSDCCVCKAIAVGDPVEECPDIQCLQPQCDALQIDEVFCRFGTCVTEKLNCDAATIACNALPPDCEPGFLPGVTEDNLCWTGGCVPIDSCNVVPNCETCPNGQMCVIDETQLGSKIRCEPIPADCMGQPTCKCAEEACDTPNFDTCAEQQGGLHCSCPVC